MQRGRDVLHCKGSTLTAVQEVRHEARGLYEDFQPTLTCLRTRFHDIDLITASLPVKTKALLHAHYTRMYCLGLGVGIIINCILNALEDDGNRQLRQETSQMSDEILQLSDVVNQYRPLGALYMRHCLLAAYVGGTEGDTRTRAIESLVDYQGDSWGSAVNISQTGLDRIVKHFTLQ